MLLPSKRNPLSCVGSQQTDVYVTLRAARQVSLTISLFLDTFFITCVSFPPRSTVFRKHDRVRRPSTRLVALKLALFKVSLFGCGVPLWKGLLTARPTLLFFIEVGKSASLYRFDIYPQWIEKPFITSLYLSILKQLCVQMANSGEEAGQILFIWHWLIKNEWISDSWGGRKYSRQSLGRCRGVFA